MTVNEATVLEMETSNARFTAWMRGNLGHAADHFGLRLIGEPVFGWRLRSIGASATGPDGRLWLRVVSEYPRWACGDGWVGNAEANTLPIPSFVTVMSHLHSAVRLLGNRDLSLLVPRVSLFNTQPRSTE
jgi:hypothetical protein